MKKIVIIGGGFAGAVAAKCLEKDFAVTLIDTKDYFEFTPSVLRTLVEPQHVKKIQVLHNHYLRKAQIIRATVTHITIDTIFTNEQHYSYDYLVICSGSRYQSPIKETNMVVASRAQELRHYSDKLQKAQDILIIGGGIVGVELAAEIISHYPQKKVTLVHSKPELMERSPPKAKQYAQQWLKKKKVNIVFNERVISNDGGIYTTKTGRSFQPELAFLCTGIMPNYELMKKNCSSSLNERNFLCVNDYLQVQGHQHIFAAGDVNNIKEEKTAQSAEKQARAVVKNIEQLEKKQPLIPYHPAAKPMVISLGKYNGIFIYKNFILTGFLPGIMKGIIEWKTMQKY